MFILPFDSTHFLHSNYDEASWAYANDSHRTLELGVIVEIISSNYFSFLNEDREYQKAQYGRDFDGPDLLNQRSLYFTIGPLSISELANFCLQRDNF